MPLTDRVPLAVLACSNAWQWDHALEDGRRALPLAKCREQLMAHEGTVVVCGDIQTGAHRCTAIHKSAPCRSHAWHALLLERPTTGTPYYYPSRGPGSSVFVPLPLYTLGGNPHK